MLGINHVDHARGQVDLRFIKEKWTVFYKIEDAGSHGPANWAEGAVKVAGLEKNAGYKTGSGAIIGEVLRSEFVTIEAESASEACKAVAAFYGKTIVNGKFLACKSSSLSEESALP